MKRDRIGLQLYTLRDATAQDMEGTLRRVAEIGYTAVELAGCGDSTPAGVRSVLDELGITAVAAHMPFEDYMDRRAGVFEDLETLGCKYGVVPAAPLQGADADAVARIAELLNDWGRESHERGLRLAYHNHDFDFDTMDGNAVWERLVERTDPQFVEFELDLYWAAYAGADVGDLLRRHAERITLVHAKDMADMADGEDRHDAPVGDGLLPWDDILDLGEGVDRWYIVEQDEPGDPFDDVRRSFEYLAARAS